MFRRSKREGDLDARIAQLSTRQSRVGGDLSANGAPSSEVLETAAAATDAGPPSEGRPGEEWPIEERLAAARDELSARLGAQVRPDRRALLSRGDLAKIVDAAVQAYFVRHAIAADPPARRDLITDIVQRLLLPRRGQRHRLNPHKVAVENAIGQIQPLILPLLSSAQVAEMPRPALEAQLTDMVPGLLAEAKIQLNAAEQRELVAMLVADTVGLGPLDRLLADDAISDIMVYGPKQVLLERRGKTELTDHDFRDERHLTSVCSKIAARLGHQLDETQPLVAGHLLDGSRVKIMVPPLTMSGPAIAIRKPPKNAITLDSMAAAGSLSSGMAALLKIATRIRLNILISGVGSAGKTTLLNALCGTIDGGDRVVTIEDAAELSMPQPHVLQLASHGDLPIADLLRDALPWQRDRVIIGECRDLETLDFMASQEGVMTTLNALSPIDALRRLEWMTNGAVPPRAARSRIASAVDLICHIERQRDGQRRVSRIAEVVGAKGDEFETQDLFTYEVEGDGADGLLRGAFRPSGLRPAFVPRAARYGLDRALLEAAGCGP